jgi:hypothetical protein
MKRILELLDISISKASIPGRYRFGWHSAITQNICDQFLLNHLLHHSPHESRARDTALFCSVLEVLNFQGDDDILNSHSQSSVLLFLYYSLLTSNLGRN